MKLRKILKNWLKRNFQHHIEKTRIVQHRHLRQVKINVFVFFSYLLRLEYVLMPCIALSQ